MLIRKTPLTVRIPTDLRDRATGWWGLLHLWWAVVLERTVAGRDRRRAHVARRNAAMRAAHRHGVGLERLAGAIGLTPAHIRQALRWPTGTA